MSDNKSESKGQVQQVRVRGRNFDDVVRQLVETYNSSEGWAVVKVVPSVITMDVYLERNEEQAKGASNANNAKKTTKAQEVKLDTDKETTTSTEGKGEVAEAESKTASAGGSAVNAPKAKTSAK